MEVNWGPKSDSAVLATCFLIFSGPSRSRGERWCACPVVACLHPRFRGLEPPHDQSRTGRRSDPVTILSVALYISTDIHHSRGREPCVPANLPPNEEGVASSTVVYESGLIRMSGVS